MPILPTSDADVDYIDTHCHLDDPVFADAIDDVIERSVANGVRRWINVGFEPSRWDSSAALSATLPGMRHMLGLHPGSADQASPRTFDALKKAVTDTGALAVGEIGLDFFRSEQNKREQVFSFITQLDMAIDLRLPVVIHLRAAEQEMLDVLKSRTQLPHLLFHSLDGSETLRDYILETGSLIGIGGLMTKSRSSSLREIIRTIPIGQMVLETDAPYLSPVKTRGRYNQPANIPVVAASLATLLDTSTEAIALQTTTTAERFFGNRKSG